MGTTPLDGKPVVPLPGLVSTVTAPIPGTPNPDGTFTTPAAPAPAAPVVPVVQPQASPPPVTPGVIPTPTAQPDITAATPREIQPQETVSGQMSGLLAANSPYMQAATTNANAATNARGLLSSSMGVGAAQKAAIESAMPMALQDSTIAANAALSAQQANESMTQQKQQQTAASNLSAQSAKESLARDTQAQAAQQQLQQMGIDLDIKKLDITARQALSTSIEANHQQLVVAMSKIDSTPDAEMSPDNKARAKDFMIAEFKDFANTQASLYGYPITWAPPGQGLLDTAKTEIRASSEADKAAAESSQVTQPNTNDALQSSQG